MAKRYKSAFTCPSDMSAIAQMPQTDVYMAINQPYTKLAPRYGDDINAVDAQIRNDGNAMRKGYNPQKV